MTEPMAVNYRLSVEDTVAGPMFAVYGSGIRTVLFCVTPLAGDAFAWHIEPSGMVGPFRAAWTEFGSLTTIPDPIAAHAPGESDEVETLETPPELRFTYGNLPPGFQTSENGRAIPLVPGARYLALAMGSSDRNSLEHAATTFTAR
jgi:hypothetical protein